ncbi:MAG: MAPEG family protein [Kofleriaceae bacterium]|nr:MAPEG family protein [Kofleriaceae bacterium]MCL4226869.1 MAPEG family protein [Myxococcales bacterium]
MIAYWLVLVAALLPYGFILYAKSTREYRVHGHNKHPREYEEKLVGARQRAHWAHLNGFEAFPPFAAGVVIAVIAGVPEARVNLIAGVFVACRVAHGLLYIADLDKLRSLAWFGGLGAVSSLYVLAAT